MEREQIGKTNVAMVLTGVEKKDTQDGQDVSI